MLLKTACLLLLLAITSIGPGFAIVRRLRWNPLEKLCGAIVLSLLLVYLTSFAFFWLDLGATAYYISSAVCVLLTVVAWADLWRVISNRQVRRVLLWFAALFVWCLAILSIIRHFSGGGFGGDWFEHYQRCLFFLHKFPADKLFIDLYTLPARPPMMNLLTAYYMAQVGAGFEVFQLIFLFLNALIFIPCCLIARYFARRAAKRVALIAALFALNPMFIQNVTYTWTKLLAAFFVVLSTWFYLRALRKGGSLRMISAFTCLAMGLLVHYSVGVYVVIFVLHYLIFVLWRRKRRWSELAAVTVISMAVLFTWIGWSIRTYGAGTTFASNTTVTSSSRLSARQNIEKIANNVLHTVLPHPLWDFPNKAAFYNQPSQPAYWRDYTFLIYQTNAILAMGCIGGMVVVFLAARMLWKAPPRLKVERRFWIMFIPLAVLGGIAVVGEPDNFGLAHVCLQAMLLLGLTFLAVNLPNLPKLIRWIIIASLVVDFGAGVYLQASVQNLIFSVVQQGQQVIITPSWGEMTRLALVKNWYGKAQENLTFWGDHFDSVTWLIQSLLILGCGVWIWRLISGVRQSAALAVRAGAGQRPRSTTSGKKATRKKA